jgi:Ca2+-binding RTX toxin-like protein
MSFDPIFQLSSLDGTNGFMIAGEATNDRSGESALFAGDVNGDGYDDIIVGAPHAQGDSANTGAAYVVFGRLGGFGPEVDLSTLDGANGFKLSGETPGSLTGLSVSAAGDMNGDGIGDLIVGSPFAEPNGSGSGESFILFGTAGGFSAEIDLATLNGSNGFKLGGDVADNVGWSVSQAGDINGDGFDDVIVGAPSRSDFSHTGVSYVVFGKSGGFAANLDPSDFDGSNGFKISGETARDECGTAVSFAGDVNGDGFDDLIIGADGFDLNDVFAIGAVYVIFGKAAGFSANLNLSDLDGTNGFKLTGEAALDNAGEAVSSAGDINGDGYSDIVIGADRANSTFGATYVVFGKADGFAANFSLAGLDGSNGFKISGQGINEFSGRRVAPAGDVNGDGFDDLIIGATGGDYSGVSFVVFGKAGGFAANLDLSSLDGSTGFKIVGVAAGDRSGYSATAGGDINGDGLDDLLIGAPAADPNGSESGAAYVIFGIEPDSSVNLTGTVASQNLVGGASNDTLSGLGGDDNLFGHAGDDLLDGGDGNDAINAGDGSDTIIGGHGEGNDTYDGGTGMDAVTYASTTSGIVVDLSALQNQATGSEIGTDQLQNIENVTGGSGDDQITGSQTNNQLSGLSGNDLLIGGSGNDTLTGDGGLDRASYSGARSAYTITHNVNGSWTVAGPEGTDTLTTVERLVFSDQTVVIRASPVADFSGEGNGDFLWQNTTTRQAAVWLMNGQSVTSGSAVGGTPGVGWAVKSSGDFNGDGKSDIVWQNTNTRQAVVWLMNGLSVTSGSVVGGTPNAGWQIIGSGDFDGDTKSDILWQNTTSRQAAVWLMNGLGVTGGGVVGGVPNAGWVVKGSGDFNGDGKSDILWQNTTTRQAAVWLMNGLGVAGGSVIGSAPNAGWVVKGSGDFNGDGKSDILWQNTNTRQAAVWLMNGLTVTGGGVVGGTPNAGWNVVGTADTDGDGKSDILWQNTNGQALVWLMNGLSVTSASNVGSNPGPAWHLIGPGG